jgi:hypothetical protein
MHNLINGWIIKLCLMSGMKSAVKSSKKPQTRKSVCRALLSPSAYAGVRNFPALSMAVTKHYLLTVSNLLREYCLESEKQEKEVKKE